MKSRQSFLLVLFLSLTVSVSAMDFYCEIEQDEDSSSDREDCRYSKKQLTHSGIKQTILSGITLEDVVNYFVKHQGFHRSIMSKNAMKRELQALFSSSKVFPSCSAADMIDLLLKLGFEIDDIDVFITQNVEMVSCNIYHIYACILLQIAEGRIENKKYFREMLDDSVSCFLDEENPLIQGSYSSVKNIIRCAWEQTNKELDLDFEQLMQDIKQRSRNNKKILSPISISECFGSMRTLSCDNEGDF